MPLKRYIPQHLVMRQACTVPSKSLPHEAMPTQTCQCTSTWPLFCPLPSLLLMPCRCTRYRWSWLGQWYPCPGDIQPTLPCRSAPPWLLRVCSSQKCLRMSAVYTQGGPFASVYLLVYNSLHMQGDQSCRSEGLDRVMHSIKLVAASDRETLFTAAECAYTYP